MTVSIAAIYFNVQVEASTAIDWVASLPLIRGAILGGSLLGFTLSVDEVVVTLFLTGAEPTLPVWVWNQKRFGLTPAVNAIFTLIGVATLVLVLVAQRLVLVQRLPQQ